MRLQRIEALRTGAKAPPPVPAFALDDVFLSDLPDTGSGQGRKRKHQETIHQSSASDSDEDEDESLVDGSLDWRAKTF